MSSAAALHLVAAACAVHEANPGELAVRCFSARRDESALNPHLGFACVGFTRVHGDWLGVVITPQFVVLLPGGGSLWGDIPAGQRRYVDLSHATLAFVAAEDPCLGPYQHAALVSEISALPDMAAAIRLAEQFMTCLFPAARRKALGASGRPFKGGLASAWLFRRRFRRHRRGRYRRGNRRCPGRGWRAQQARVHLEVAALWNVLLVQPVLVGRAGGKQGGKQEGGWKKYAHHRQAGMNKPA